MLTNIGIAVIFIRLREIISMTNSIMLPPNADARSYSELDEIHIDLDLASRCPGHLVPSDHPQINLEWS